MPSLPQAAVVLFVSDVHRVSRFYEGVGGMVMVHDAADHVILETHGMQLVVHAMRWSDGDQAGVAGGVVVREDSYLKFCFPVVSIAAARSAAFALGGAIKPASAEWEARGFRACDGHDPEGNVLQVREPAP